ncbi:hypothetical protein, partial [Puniceicoccus vermicola]|uniref:hypothetical protein n=1 Tax=Puniceicoccus vermicola TaxID=388746 RepID=UPI001C8C142D
MLSLLSLPHRKRPAGQPSHSSESFQLSLVQRKSRAGCSRYFLFSTAKDLLGNPAIVVRASSSLSSYANREQ